MQYNIHNHIINKEKELSKSKPNHHNENQTSIIISITLGIFSKQQATVIYVKKYIYSVNNLQFTLISIYCKLTYRTVPYGNACININEHVSTIILSMHVTI